MPTPKIELSRYATPDTRARALIRFIRENRHKKVNVTEYDPMSEIAHQWDGVLTGAGLLTINGSLVVVIETQLADPSKRIILASHIRTIEVQP